MSEKRGPDKHRTPIPLTIDLEGGFKDDTVIVRVNGKKEAHEEGVTTDYSAGIAGTVNFELPPGQVTIEVALPKRNLARAITLQPTTDTFLIATISQGKLEVWQRKPGEPREYY